MKKQLFIFLLLIFFVPCLIYGEDHDNYAIYDGSSISYTNKTAYVYLDDDVSLSNSLIINSGYTLHLCLHGHKLLIDGSKEAITIYNNATLILSDCTNSGSITSSGGYGVYNNGTFNFYSGSISNNGNSGVYNKAIFNMYDGTILNNSASNGGGVKNEKTFNMYAGSIKDNAASLSGGGVYNGGANATFNMCGVSLISGNTVKTYGGAGVYNNGSTFTMSDNSSITNNIANSISGGGLYAYNSKVTIKDNASIINNKANVNGKGIYFYSGNLYVNDDVLIDDIYLPSNKTITVLDKLGEKASIGLSVEYPYKLPTVVTNSNNVNSFYCNNENYSLEALDNTIKLIKAISYPTYTVDIPSSISLDEELKVQASIDESSTLIVKLASDNDFTLTSEDDISISYLIKQDGTILKNNDVILKVNGSSASTLLRFESQDKPKYAGTYTGTVMFTVYIEEK